MKNLYLFVLLLFSSLLSFSQIESGAIDITFECLNGDDTTLFDNWVASNGGAIASNDCGDVTWSYISTEINSFCSDIVTVTFTATNDCGTEETAGTVFFQDTLSPSLGVQADDRSVVCDGSGNTTELNAWLTTNGGAFAFDECSDVTWSNDFTELTTDCNETVSIEVGFTASDDCGNQSTTLATFFIESGENSCPDGPITLNSQAEVDAFAIDYPNCTALIDNLSISGSDIVDLTPLAQVTEVGGLLIDNTGLATLTGLQNLTALNGQVFIGIGGNPSLTSITALANLNDNGGLDSVQITNNPLLASLEGLEWMSSVLDLFISDNNSLEDLNGLNGLAFCSVFVVRNNSGLISLSGLPLENSEFGSFNIENNDSLENLTGMQGVTLTYELIIVNNDALINLDGINNLTSELEYLSLESNMLLSNISALDGVFLVNQPGVVIIDNQNLAICSIDFICSFPYYTVVTPEPPGQQLIIENNAEGCNSVTEVEAQCPTCPPENTNLVLNTQEEIDNFSADYSDCTAVSGLLIISGADITNLSGLSSIESVAGFEIVNNPLLQNLDGLENLTTLQDGFTIFSISDNVSLESISGLSGITGSLSHVINIRNNPVLQSLNGLEGITGIEDVCLIINNDSLTDLTGLTNFEGCDDLYIQDNDALESIEGLATSFSTGRFYLINNDAIVSLQNQSLINPSCGIEIRDNDLLEDIDGFTGVFNFECGLDFEIINNPNLSICSTPYTCDYISNISLSQFDRIEVRDNAPGCDTVFEISSGCDQEPLNDECEGGQLEELVIGQSYTVSFDLATQSSYIPTCNDSEDRADVWFTFNSDSITSLTLSVGTGNAFQLWEGNCDDLTAISELCGSNQISFDTPVNKQYYLQLWANSYLDRSVDLTDGFEIIIQDATLALNDFDLDDFKVFPNPFKDQLNLIHTRPIETIYIHDIHGKLVEVLEINAMNITLNLSEYASGMYFLKLESEDNTATRKIIKR